MKRTLFIIEKVFIRIGAVLGVLSTIILLKTVLLKPTPPNVDVTFLLSNSNEINYAQQLSDPKQSFSESFPIGLTIHNKGGTVAKNVVLSIFSTPYGLYAEFIHKFEGVQVDTKKISRGGSFISIYRIQLGNINPGEKIFLDENIWCKVFNINKITPKVPFKSNKEKSETLDLLRITYEFEVMISSENTEPKKKYLYLTTGLEGHFENKPHYTYHKGRITLKNTK